MQTVRQAVHHYIGANARALLEANPGAKMAHHEFITMVFGVLNASKKGARV